MARSVLLIDALEGEDRRDEFLERARLRRNLRDQANPLSVMESGVTLRKSMISLSLSLSETEFRAHYRLSKELFSQLCIELKPHMPTTRRRTKVSLVLTALSFYATGSYQKPVGMNFLHGLSQPSVSNAVKEVTKALNSISILQKYIRFPQTREERQTIINGFYNKFGFPGVLGCIDGTHVAMVRPNEHEERFFNRKHYHSRNVQIICDSDLNILNVDATFGGASHDAYIWRQSEINLHIQQLHNNGETLWLLGDSGYPLRPWLLTPIVNAGPETPEEHYTNVHCKARNTVERCIGVLKSRWRCLLVHRVLHYDHHTVAKIINACCVLHNMANTDRLPVPELSPVDSQAERNQQVPHRDQVDDQNESQMLQNGRQQVSTIVRRLWNNRT